MTHETLRTILLTIFLLLGPHHASAFVAPVPVPASPLYPNKTMTVLEIKDTIYGVRKVGYWRTDDGLAVIDGDVIYGTVDELLAHEFNGREQRAESIFSNQNPWAGATILYNFNSAATQALLTPIVNGAIANWKANANAPYLTFKRVANSATGIDGVLTIKAPVCGGCNTPVGYGNVPLTMNLQQSCPAAPGSCGVPEATHEFGHALGLYHEHQRFDREKYVHYNCANLNPSCPAGVSMPPGTTCCSSSIPTGCCATAFAFSIYETAAIDHSGSFDIHSIMEYRANAFALPGTDTLTAVAPGIVVPPNNPKAISPTDSLRVCKIYPSKCPRARACAAAGCPSICVPIKRCTKPSICNVHPSMRPPCCRPSDCTAERDACTAKGCNFLMRNDT